MRISSSVEYGMRLMVCLARQPEGARMSAEQLSESENVPKDYVDQLLQRLRKAGLVASHRGAAGGYSLARRSSEVSVGDVIRAVESRIFEEPCDRFSAGEKDCHHQGACGIKSVWTELGSLIEQHLDSVTLERLLQPSFVYALKGGK